VALQEQLGSQPLFIYSERSWVYTKDIHKLSGLLGSPAFFAALIAMSSAFVIYRFTQAKTFGWRLFYALTLAYVSIGVYYTYNRGGYIALALCLLLGAIVWPAFRRVFIAAAIVGGAALALSWSTVQQSSVVSQRIGARGPIEYRAEIWRNAAQIFSRSPIMGLGYSNFGAAYIKFDPTSADITVLPAPHNSVLEVAFDSGLVGVIPYVTMFALIIAGAFGFVRRARDGLGAGLATAFAIAIVPYLVEAMVIDMVSAYYVNMVMMLVVGALFGWQSSRQPETATASAV
jgi:O-antigen ligase